jgi:hypothetical protein
LVELNIKLKDARGGRAFLAGWDVPGGPFYSVTTVYDEPPVVHNWGGQGGVSFSWDNHKAGMKAQADKISDLEQKAKQLQSDADRETAEVKAIKGYMASLAAMKEKLGPNAPPAVLAVLAAAQQQAQEDLNTHATAGGLDASHVAAVDMTKPAEAVRFKDPAAAAKAISSIPTPVAIELATTNRGFTLVGFGQRFKNWGTQFTATVFHYTFKKPGYGKAKHALDEAKNKRDELKKRIAKH